MPERTERYAINSVLRAAQILESFSLEKPTYSHSEISKKLGLNKTAVTRLLSSLEKAGLLEKDSESGRYGLTVKLYQIGSVYINRIGISEAARPVLSELAASCNESSHLSVLHEFEVLYIDKVECPRPIRMMSYVGRKLPAYCTGTGKVFLAHLSEPDLKVLFSRREDEANHPQDPHKPRGAQAGTGQSPHAGLCGGLGGKRGRGGGRGRARAGSNR